MRIIKKNNQENQGLLVVLIESMFVQYNDYPDTKQLFCIRSAPSDYEILRIFAVVVAADLDDAP